MIADGSLMTEKQLNAWVEGAANLQMIAEYTVPWVTVENPQARDLAMQWIKSKNEHTASAGWCTYSGIVAIQPDDRLDLAEIEELLNKVVKESKIAQGRVLYTMNSFVIAVGSYVKPLSIQAKAAAKQVGEVSVDMGDTSCKVPHAIASIEKVEASGKLGQKRKTIRA